MDLSYFRKVNNTFASQSKQETDLFLLNRQVEECFADTIDYHQVKRNGEDYELIIIKDTDGNTNKKKIKCRPSQPFNLGDYIEWNNQIWLITLLDPDNKTYRSGYMYLCTILVRCQNTIGNLIERWAYAEDYTKYSTGQTGNDKVTIGDYQYGLTVPSDTETRTWKRGLRTVIDYEGNYPPDVYELTNRKAYLNDNSYFDRGGVITFTFSYDFFNEQSDKLITLEDGSQAWICDYHSPTTEPAPPDETANLSVSISGGDTLMCGFPNTWTVSFKDKEGLDVADNAFEWNIVSNFKIAQTIDGNKIRLNVSDDSLIGESFLLQISTEGAVLAELDISIVGIF